MSVKVVGFNGNAFDQNSIDGSGNRFLKTLCQLILSGSYATGGDTLDFTNAGVNSAVPPAQSQNAPKVKIYSIGPSGSIGANGGNFQFIPGTLITNGKLKIFATAGTEYSAGAYSTDATTDVILAEIWWPR